MKKIICNIIAGISGGLNLLLPIPLVILFFVVSLSLMPVSLEVTIIFDILCLLYILIPLVTAAVGIIYSLVLLLKRYVYAPTICILLSFTGGVIHIAIFTLMCYLGSTF